MARRSSSVTANRCSLAITTTYVSTSRTCLRSATGAGPVEMAASRVLVVNAGSSSLKLRLIGDSDEPLAARDLDCHDDWEEGLKAFLADTPPPDRAGHRVVHGGERFVSPVWLDDQVVARLEELEDLAPLHNPPA